MRRLPQNCSSSSPPWQRRASNSALHQALLAPSSILGEWRNSRSGEQIRQLLPASRASHYFVDDLLKRQLDTDGHRLVLARVLERVELALQQGGVKESRQAFVQHLERAVQVDETHRPVALSRTNTSFHRAPRRRKFAFQVAAAHRRPSMQSESVISMSVLDSSVDHADAFSTSIVVVRPRPRAVPA